MGLPGPTLQSDGVQQRCSAVPAHVCLLGWPGLSLAARCICPAQLHKNAQLGLRPAQDRNLCNLRSPCLPCTLSMQLHKNAQLGLKPAPNGREFRWSAFGSPPPPGGLPPSQVRGAVGQAGSEG